MIFESNKTSYLRNIALQFVTFSKSIDFLKVNQTFGFRKFSQSLFMRLAMTDAKMSGLQHYKNQREKP